MNTGLQFGPPDPFAGLFEQGISNTGVNNNGTFNTELNNPFGSYNAFGNPFNYDLNNLPSPSIRDQIAENAASLAGSAYVSGEERMGATDCSGTVFYSYTQAGVDIPRLTAQGYHDMMTPVTTLQPGDIITYSNSDKNGAITHVQVYIGVGVDRNDNIVTDAVINAGSERTGVYVVSLSEYTSWDATQNLTPHYGTLLE